LPEFNTGSEGGRKPLSRQGTKKKRLKPARREGGARGETVPVKGSAKCIPTKGSQKKKRNRRTKGGGGGGETDDPIPDGTP